MLQPATRTGRPAARRRACILLTLELLLLTIVLALPDGAFAYRVAGAGGWSTQTSGTVGNFLGIAFSDATNGWAVGEGGMIVATTNGGVTWSAQVSGTTQDLNAVAFVDATHGLVVGGHGTILATANGGATWTMQSMWNTAYLVAASFGDATYGWATGGSGTVFATTDGGTSWSAQNSGSGVFLSAVTFTDADHGWAVGQNGAIVATTNGGATWIPQSSGSAAWLRSIAFADAAHGWAAGMGGAILSTTTGGLAPPSIAKLKPAFGRRGGSATITGSGFGAKRGAGVVKFGAVSCVKYVSWSVTKITCRVPAKAKYGVVKVTVKTAVGKSSAKSFNVKR
jgi:photosystem II stability/assembly factor-like uncharacterized protein